MSGLELTDIQGIIRTGYGLMKAACFVFLEIEDPKLVKGWLKDLDLKDAIKKKDDPQNEYINVAFTHLGLQILGLHAVLDEAFSREFEEGMTGGNRPDILGDHEKSGPDQWAWGGTDKSNPKNQEHIHILLLLYAKTDVHLHPLYERQSQKFAAAGLKEVKKLDTIHLSKRKEHFGFRDGISQPWIAGKEGDKEEEEAQRVYREGGSSGNFIAAGEFILGYKNVYEEYTSSPTAVPEKDPGGILPPSVVDVDSHTPDFGRNGSYLVFRQLSQDVKQFWGFVDDKTRDPSGSSNPEARVKLASKMVGRWPSGAPLANDGDQDPYPDKDHDDLLPLDKKHDKFGFNRSDPYGESTPLSSHIRRANPRDSLADQGLNPRRQRTSQSEDTKEAGKRRATALSSTNSHRIIRRGRAYGKPVADSLDPGAILDTPQPEGERGLHFLCFNANLARQFEFVQHTWINNPKFHDLYSDVDPLIGDHHSKNVDRGLSPTFTVPGEPIRQRISGLSRFVQVRGGAYFFMPGIKAVKYLASLPD